MFTELVLVVRSFGSGSERGLNVIRESEMQLTVGPVGPRGQNFRGSGK